MKSTLAVFILSATLVANIFLPSASSAKPALSCEQKALTVATALYQANQNTFSSRSAVLVSETPSESGNVLTWDIHFKDLKGYESSVPYRIELIREHCFVFAFSLPGAA